MLREKIQSVGTGIVVLLGTVAFANTPQVFADSINGSSTSTLQAKAARIAQQITADQQQEQITGERFDSANVVYQQAQSRLVTIQRQLAKETRQLKIVRAKMRKAVVSAYVYGFGAQAEVGAVLSGHSINDAGSLSTYAGAATNQLHAAVVSVNAVQTQLLISERDQASTTNAAAVAASTAQNAHSVANQLATNATNLLARVNDKIATLIAEQAAAAAKAAAEAAAAATNASQRSAAQTQAQNQAALAQTIASSNPSGSTTAAAQSAAGSSTSANNVGAPTVLLGPATTEGQTAVLTAASYLGVPYVWGGASATGGFDCSGLTMVAWAAGGVTLTHSAYDQYLHSSPIPITNHTITLEPGDLLYYFFPDDGGQPVTHVVMYVGSGIYGTKTVIAAPRSGEDVMYQQLYWGGFVGAGRP